MILSAQTNIGGVINQARRVYQIASFNELRISGTQIFAAGDTVLLIQMKGASIVLDANEENWGNRQSLRNAGLNEFLIVSGIDGDKVTFTRNLKNHALYNPNDVLQLVKVPAYNNARINSTLTAPAWDGEKGGILAFIVKDTLRFNANIDVSGKGFRGLAAVNSVSGDCQLSSVFAFDESYAFAGRKGEGLALYSDPPLVPFGTNYAKGRGKVINGGGGGNGRFAGGGGGGNAASGGFGGRPDSECAGSDDSHRATTSRGIGDFITELGDIGRRLVMAGGGGSGTGTTISSGGKGGNAGGMVIIIARVVIGNGRSIIANGENGETVPGGGGGGGAGGTVVLSIDNYIDSDALSVQLNGGSGGNSQGVGVSKGGPGGGGSHGVLLFKQAVKPVQLFTINDVGGAGVALNSTPGDSRGASGGELVAGTLLYPNLRLVLNGFLFQSISKNQLVCQNTTPSLISGSDPVGGISPYTYQWRISVDGGFTYDNIGGATGKNYQPPFAANAGTFYYQRRTRDAAGPDQITDDGLPVKVEVLPALQNFWVAYGGGDICAGQTHLSFGGATPSGGNGVYSYIWQKQITGNWADATDFSTQQIFTPEPLNNTTNFRRITNSSVCTATSDPVTVTVRPVITNNVIQSAQDVCSGSVPLNLTGENPAGATGVYNYFWQYRTGGIWNPAAGGNQQNYIFGSGITVDTYYRRVVTSGPCTSNSNEVFLDVIPVITNNIIIRAQSDTALCVNTTGSLTGSTPGGGRTGDMRYFWEYSLNQADWNSAPLANSQKNYTTDARPVSTYYRRVALSGVNNACRDTTDTYLVFVDDKQNVPVITATPDELWLAETVSLVAPTPLKGAGKWEQEILASEPSVNIVNPNSLSAEVFLQNETNHDLTYKFNWRISYLNCEDVVASANVSVKPLFKPNAFSPNDDGDNDYLTFTGLGGSGSNELSIFNRQGNLVFRAVNYQIGYSEEDTRLWDGRDLKGNTLRDDTYFYTLLVNNRHYFKGFIILKRQ